LPIYTAFPFDFNLQNADMKTKPFQRYMVLFSLSK